MYIMPPLLEPDLERVDARIQHATLMRTTASCGGRFIAPEVREKQ